MGVKKLWDLLEPCGRRISIEALTGKRLAVDASGWLFQFIKAMRDERGDLIRNAHLVGFFRRICRLLFHRIKPVFVFDGATPAIKRMTVIARRRQREQQDARLRRTAEKLLLNQLKQHALAQVASQGGSDVLAQMAGTQKSRGKRPDPFQEVVVQDTDAAAGGRAAGAQPHAVPAQCVPEGPALGASAPQPGEVEQELEAHLDLDLDQLGGVESGEIDAEVLSQLPPSVQLEVMLKLREAQVVANREKFAAAQGAPLAFSQVQMAQYLKATAFRRQVNEIKEAVNAAAGLLGASRRIAGEPGREYVLLRDEEAPDGPGVPGAQGASSPPEPSAAPASSAAPPSSGGPLPAQDPLVLTFGASDLDPATDASEEEVGWEDVEEEPSLPGMLASPGGSTEPVPDVGLREQRDLHWRERAARRQRFWSLAQGFRQGRALSDWGKAGDGAQDSPALSPGRAEDGTRDEEEQALQAAIEASLQESREAWEVAGGSGPSGSGPARGGRESGWVGTLPPETALPPLAPDCQASFAGASETNQASHAPASGSEEDWEDVATEPAPPGLAPSRVAAGVNTASETELNRLLSGARASAPDKPGQGLAVGLSVETVAPPHVGVSASAEKHSPAEELVSAIASTVSALAAGAQVEAILTEAGPTGGVEIQALDSPSGPQVSPEKKALETNTAGIVEGGKALNAVAADPLQPDAGELPADAPQASAMNHVLAAAPLLQEAVLAAAQAPLVEDSAPSPAAAAEAADVTEFLGDMEPEAEEEEPLTFVDDFGPGIGPGEAEAGLEALRHEALGLRQAQRAQRGQADAPTDEMYTEIQDMLQMFGVPYIVAPGEAEAQCAWLDAAGLVDGVITDDDDAFLFGAQTVYRHIFSTKQTVEEYRTRDVESELGLSRPEFISLALLLGSDYTPGVRGIGIVNATEVVHAFQGMEGLQDFRAWVQAPDAAVSELIAKATEGGGQPSAPGSNSKRKPLGVTDEATQSMRRAFQLRHRGVRRNWDLPSDFPSPAVLEAYLSPRLDTSRDRFLFGRPDLALLRSLCTARLEWTPVQADELLLPVLKAWDEREHQQTLEPFLAFRKRFAKIQSKRLQHAVRGIAGKTTAELELAGSPSAEAGTARKPRAARSRAKTAKRAQSAVPAAQAGQVGASRGNEDVRAPAEPVPKRITRASSKRSS
uniref:DNA repair protein UVH3 n=1 Tax=Auxenochlorella protothecoides TaxID=3075 RepID=A0A1D1ZZQ1_AUXPR